MRKRAPLLAALGLVLATPSFAVAQELREPSSRQGYYIGFGVGNGALVFDTDAFGTLPGWRGGSFALHLGEAINDWASLGVSISVLGGEGKKRQGSLMGLEMTAGALIWRHLSLNLGLGFGLAQISNKSATSLSETEGGVSAFTSVTVRYDFFPFYDHGSGGFAISPTLTLVAVPSDSVRGYAVMLGATAAWWLGLDANKLEPAW